MSSFLIAASEVLVLIGVAVALVGCTGPEGAEPDTEIGSDLPTTSEDAGSDLGAPNNGDMSGVADAGNVSDATRDVASDSPAPPTDTDPGDGLGTTDLSDRYVRVDGDPQAPTSCAQVCQGVGLTCDGEYDHFLLGSVGGVAFYGLARPTDCGASLTCDDVPAREWSDPLDTRCTDLRAFECYCRSGG